MPKQIEYHSQGDELVQQLIAFISSPLALALFVVALIVFLKRSSSSKKKKSATFNSITDKFTSLDEVTNALREAGLESSNLILAIDYTASNESQGSRTFGGKCLHAVSNDLMNPYQRVISVVGRTLSKFDEDGFIPAFGFGDIHTKDYDVFPLSPSQLQDPRGYFHSGLGASYCNGVDEVLRVYNAITPHVKLSGPTNFAPVIKKAIEIVSARAKPEYHILVIVADGQVVNEKETEDAIVEASNYPLSIILIGVGDGPWDTMETYDDELPQRRFDNFQFVNYNDVMKTHGASKQDIAFALASLMELPEQYKAIRKLNLLASRH